MTVIDIKDKINFFLFLLCLIYHNQAGYQDNHFIFYTIIKYNYVSILFSIMSPLTLLFMSLLFHNSNQIHANFFLWDHNSATLELILRGVWECGNGCFLKCFFARKCIKIIYFFKKIYLI